MSNHTHEYRPEILHPGIPNNLERISQLRHHPNVTVFDEIHAQLVDLIKTRHPKEKVAPDQIESMIYIHLDQKTLDEYGVWVYYPWSNRLVHLLDEEEFIELRTDRNHHKITEKEQQQLSERRIGIVGLSVGQSVALTLALERACGELRLADFDHIDLSNLNRLRCGVHELGVSKAIVAAREIAEFDPFLRVTCFLDGLTEDNAEEFFNDLDLVIDECDSLDIKLNIRLIAKKKHLPVLMNTSDRGMTDIERFDLDPERPIFHGLLFDLDPETLQGLSTREKVPHVMRMMQSELLSARLRASFLEIEQSISTWPQLASDVVLGGAAITNVARRLLLDQNVQSGRYLIDLTSLIGEDPFLNIANTHNEPNIQTSAQIQAITEAPISAEAMHIDNDMEQIITAASFAPSQANLQPWMWRQAEGHLELLLSDQGDPSFLNFEERASKVTLGAALENAVLKAHHLGYSVGVELFPEALEPRLVARISFGDGTDEPATYDHLAAFIEQRQTHRRRGPRKPLSEAQLETLEHAAESIPESNVEFISQPSSLKEIAKLIGAGERLRFLDRTMHAELLSELRWSRAEALARGNGVFIDELELSASERPVLDIIRDRAPLELIQQWNEGWGLGKIASEQVNAASAIGLLTMERQTEASFVSGGRALERLWLSAEQQQIGLQPMTVLPYLLARLEHEPDTFEPFIRESLTELASRFSELFHTAQRTVIMLFRLVPIDQTPSTRSVRRPISAILEQPKAMLHR